MAHEEFERQVDNHADRKHHANQRRNSNELSNQLAGIAVKKPGNRPSDAVPASAVIACTVREQSDRDHSPQSIRAVYRNCADWVIHLQYIFNEGTTDANDEAADEANDAGTDRV